MSRSGRKTARWVMDKLGEGLEVRVGKSGVPGTGPVEPAIESMVGSGVENSLVWVEERV